MPARNLVVRFTAVTAWENINFSQGFASCGVAAEEAGRGRAVSTDVFFLPLSFFAGGMMRAGNGEICSSSAALI